MSWSTSNADRLSTEDAAEAIKNYRVSSDNKAQEFGHVGKVKDLAIKELEQLPAEAQVRFSIGGHTDSEEVWQGYCNIQFSVGY